MRQPTDIFEITRYDTAGIVLDSAKFSPEQVEDYQRFTLSAEVAYVEIVCYEAGGQMLASKLLRFMWE